MYHPTTSHNLLLAAMFLAALPCLSGQLPPATAPIPSAEPPALDCFPYLLNLSDCLTFVQGGMIENLGRRIRAPVESLRDPISRVAQRRSPRILEQLDGVNDATNGCESPFDKSGCLILQRTGLQDIDETRINEKISHLDEKYSSDGSGGSYHGSNLTKPDPGCCPELANLVDTQPICLCQLLGNPGQAGISVDINRALKLPAVCNVTTPPVSLCAAIGVPVAAVSPSHEVQPPSSDGVISASPSPGIEGGPSNLASNHNFKISLALVPLVMIFILF